jgi:hypothetical protein
VWLDGAKKKAKIGQKAPKGPQPQKFTWLEPVRAVTRGFAEHFYYILAIVSQIFGIFQFI